MQHNRQSQIPTLHFKRFALAVMLFASCGYGIAAQQSTPAGHKLQVLKDCKLVSERALTASELSAWQDLKTAELKMDQLQIPLDQMSEALSPLQDKMDQLSAELEQQTKRDRMPDETLLEQTRLTADRIEDITDSYQGDIDAISSFSQEMERVANVFKQQMTKDLPDGSYDQLRVLLPGEINTSGCQTGMFLHKSIDKVKKAG